MAFGGIGSRSSPIVIDDDDDDALPLPSARVDSSSSTLPKDCTPPQPVDLTEAWDPTPARQENQLRTGKGYSILVRMGYKPGYGLGVNLEGIRPLSASLLCG
jgi:G-patch domain